MFKVKAIYEPSGKAKEYADLAVNLYTGCPHGCTYCYSPKIVRKKPEDFHSNVRIRDYIVDKIRQDCEELATKQNVLPIHMCFTCDPYPYGHDTTATRMAIQVIKKHGLNFTVLTKSGEGAERDFDLYEDGDSFGCTLTMADSWEPSAESHQSRRIALYHAYERGIRTWASLEPVIFPGRTLEAIKRTAPFVDHYKLGKLNYHPRANMVDWRKFTSEAIELLETLGKSYYIKDSLKPYLKAAAND